jgi:hypothetical protein
MPIPNGAVLDITFIMSDGLIKHNINLWYCGAVLYCIMLYYSLFSYNFLGCIVLLLRFDVVLLYQFKMVQSWSYLFFRLIASSSTTLTRVVVLCGIVLHFIFLCLAILFWIVLWCCCVMILCCYAYSKQFSHGHIFSFI